MMSLQWTYAQLRSHFAARSIDDRATWAQISDIVVLTLLALAAEARFITFNHIHHIIPINNRCRCAATAWSCLGSTL